MMLTLNNVCCIIKKMEEIIMNLDKENIYIIKTIRQVNFLIKEGNDLIGVKNSLENFKSVVFVFERTPKLLEDIKKYQDTKDKM